MRRLLTTRTNKSFTVLKDIISNKVEEIDQYQRNFGIEFEKQLKQLILDKRNHSQKIRKLAKKYTKICITSGKPVETILKEFLDHTKKYDEEDLIEATQFVGKAFQMGIIDHGGHLDRSGYKLIESPVFDHFIQQIKYSLSQRAYIGISNISKILNSLEKLNYLDSEILNLVLVRLQTELQLKKPIKFTPREYQIEKKGYYNYNIIGFDKQILKNQQVLETFEYYDKKKLQFANKITFDNVKKEDFENQENYQVVVELVEKFQKFNHGVEQLVEGVIAVRQQYRKLVTISQNQKVMRHPQLNSSALYVQERLLQMHLITYEDIQNPQQILNKQKQLKKVENIVKILMSQADLDNFEDFLVKESKNLEYLQRKKQNKLSEYCQLLEAVAKYASSPYKLNGNDTKVTLLNTKWQRSLIGDSFKQNNIEADRIFRKAYVQTQKFIQDNMQTLISSLSEATFVSKIRWFSALLQLGFYQQFSTQLKQIKINAQLLQNLPEKQLMLCIKIFNSFYQVDKQHVNTFYPVIQKRLTQILDTNEFYFEIEELCNCINLIYQTQQPAQDSQNTLYRKLILLLVEAVKGLQYNGAINPQIYRQAKRILIFESPDSIKISASLSTLAQLESLTSSKPSNPYIQTLYSSLHPNPSTTPYIPLGISSQNQCRLNCMYIADSMNSSIKGTAVSGNINAYCLRLSNKFNINCLAVPITKFINLIWNDESKGHQGLGGEKVKIKIKSSDQIIKILGDLQDKSLAAVGDLIRKASEAVANVDSGAQGRGILERLKTIAGLYSRQKQTMLIDQFYAKRLQVLFEFQLLKRDIKLINKQKLNQIESKLQDNQRLTSLISQLQKQLVKPLQKIQKRYKQIWEKAGKPQKIFKGKRISIDLLSDETQPVSHSFSASSLINLPYMLDTTYIEYSDWQQKVKQNVNYYELQLENISEISKLLINKYCPQIKQKIVTLPEVGGDVLVPYFPVNWESKYLYHVQNKEEKDHIEKIAGQFRGKTGKERSWDVDAIISLQNYKHQLKISKTPEEVGQMLLNLEFIDSLMESRLQKQDQSITPRPQFLPRNVSIHSNSSSFRYLHSPFLTYMHKKHSKREYLKSQLQARNQKKQEWQQKHRMGQMTSKQLRQKLDNTDKQLIKLFERELKKKGLDNVQHSRILDEGAKIVQLWGNLQNIGEESAQIDIDLLNAKSQQQLLDMKRSRAETNLILARIMYLKQTNQPLKQSHKDFLTQHTQSLKKCLQQPVPSPTSFSTKTLDNLSANDKRKLKLKHNSIIQSIPNLSLNDFIVEMNRFIDLSFITNLENEVVKEQLSNKYGIVKQAFGGFRTSEMATLTGKMEESIFDESSKLSQKQIQCIVDMSKILKTEGLSDRERYKSHYPNLQQTLHNLNKSPIRNPLVSAYLRQKDQEYYLDYHPELVTKEKEKQVHLLWRKIFNIEYEHTKANQIKQKINQICHSMLFLKLNEPPYFGSFLYELIKNPKTDVYSKEKLISYCEIFKVEIKLDSNQILQIGKGDSIQPGKIWNGLRALGKKGEIMSLL